MVNSFTVYKSPAIISWFKLGRAILNRCHSLRLDLCDLVVTNFGLLSLLAELLSALLSGHLSPSCGIPQVWQITFILAPNNSTIVLPLPRELSGFFSSMSHLLNT